MTALLSIPRAITPDGRQTTFEAGRTDEAGHADLAWALMHALENEPLEGGTAKNTGLMETF